MEPPRQEGGAEREGSDAGCCAGRHMLGQVWPDPFGAGLAGAACEGAEGADEGAGDGVAAKAATENPTIAPIAASGGASSSSSFRFRVMCTSGPSRRPGKRALETQICARYLRNSPREGWEFDWSGSRRAAATTPDN
jgi:hypothetical protein